VPCTFEKREGRKKVGNIKMKLLVVLLALLLVISSCSVVLATSLQIIYPLYSYPNVGYPDDIYPTVGAAANQVPETVIINPNSGPLPCPVPSDWQAGLDQLYTAAGSPNFLTTIGYVATGYGGGNIADIKSQVDTYFNCWGVQGIFFDEASNLDADLPTYQDLYNYVKAKGANFKVVINPGSDAPEGYTTASDVMLVFEGDYDSWLSYQPDSYLANYPSTKFGAIFYSVLSSADQNNSLELSQERNIAYVYSTNKDSSNPYFDLPQLWDQEVAVVKRSQGVGSGVGGPPPPPPPPSSTNSLCSTHQHSSCEYPCRYYRVTRHCGLPCRRRSTPSDCGSTSNCRWKHNKCSHKR